MARILIVDDAPMARSVLAFVLEKAGHEIVGTAADGREALAIYPGLQPDLVTMDIQMPVMDGLECLRKILAQDSGARVIMVSAIEPAEKEAESLNAGALAYVYKSQLKEQLLAAVNDALAR